MWKSSEKISNHGLPHSVTQHSDIGPGQAGSLDLVNPNPDYFSSCLFSFVIIPVYPRSISYCYYCSLTMNSNSGVMRAGVIITYSICYLTLHQPWTLQEYIENTEVRKRRSFVQVLITYQIHPLNWYKYKKNQKSEHLKDTYNTTRMHWVFVVVKKQNYMVCPVNSRLRLERTEKWKVKYYCDSSLNIGEGEKKI